MMASRKAVLEKNKQQLLDCVNRSNKIYTNEELSILISEMQEQNKQMMVPVNYLNSIDIQNGALNSNYNYCYKFNHNVVILNITVTLATAITANQNMTLIVLPKEVIPKGNVVISGISYMNTALTASYIQAGSGNLIIRTPQNLPVGAEVNLWGVYYVN